MKRFAVFTSVEEIIEGYRNIDATKLCKTCPPSASIDDLYNALADNLIQYTAFANIIPNLFSDCDSQYIDKRNNAYNALKQNCIVVALYTCEYLSCKDKYLDLTEEIKKTRYRFKYDDYDTREQPYEAFLDQLHRLFDQAIGDANDYCGSFISGYAVPTSYGQKRKLNSFLKDLSIDLLYNSAYTKNSRENIPQFKSIIRSLSTNKTTDVSEKRRKYRNDLQKFIQCLYAIDENWNYDNKDFAESLIYSYAKERIFHFNAFTSFFKQYSEPSSSNIIEQISSEWFRSFATVINLPLLYGYSDLHFFRSYNNNRTPETAWKSAFTELLHIYKAFFLLVYHAANLNIDTCAQFLSTYINQHENNFLIKNSQYPQEQLKVTLKKIQDIDPDTTLPAIVQIVLRTYDLKTAGHYVPDIRAQSLTNYIPNTAEEISKYLTQIASEKTSGIKLTEDLLEFTTPMRIHNIPSLISIMNEQLHRLTDLKVQHSATINKIVDMLVHDSANTNTESSNLPMQYYSYLQSIIAALMYIVSSFEPFAESPTSWSIERKRFLEIIRFALEDATYKINTKKDIENEKFKNLLNFIQNNSCD